MIMCTQVQVPTGVRGVGSPAAGFTNGYEPLDMGAGNHTL